MKTNKFITGLKFYLIAIIVNLIMGLLYLISILIATIGLQQSNKTAFIIMLLSFFGLFIFTVWLAGNFAQNWFKWR